MKYRATCLIIALTLNLAASVQAATVNILDASNPGPGTTYWVPSDAQRYAQPFVRGFGEDWGWTHAPIGVPFTTANLNVSAFDVDFLNGERDRIEAFDAATGTWLELGFLTGADDVTAFTNFILPLILLDDVAAGLQARVSIDQGWLVTLTSSALTTDGANPGDPNVSVVPIPPAMVLFASGLVGIGLFARCRKKQAV